MLAVRWYLRYGLSYRDVEELLVERGVQVDHVSIYRWVQRFTPLLIDAARPRRHATGDRWSAWCDPADPWNLPGLPEVRPAERRILAEAIASSRR